MRRLYAILGCLCLALLQPAPAAAQDNSDNPHFKLTISTEEPYAFPEGSVLPQITDEEIENSAKLSATFGALEGSFAYLTTDAGDGEQIGIALSEDKCPMLEFLGCSAAVTFQHTPGLTTRSYEAAVTYASKIWKLNPEWSLTASHEASDAVSDSIATASVSLPFQLHPRVKLKINGGVAYNFEETETEPLWGASVAFTLPYSVELDVGYKSHVKRVNEQEFKTNRKFVASLSVGF